MGHRHVSAVSSISGMRRGADTARMLSGGGIGLSRGGIGARRAGGAGLLPG